MEIRAAALLRATGERALDLAVVGMLLGGLLLPVAGAHAASGDPVLLNELLVSHTGDDTTEFVELYGTPGHALGGLSLVVVEGDGSAAGAIDLRIDFAAGDRLGGNGFFLVGNAVGLAAHYGVVPDLAVTTTLAAGFMENGSQTVALVSTAGLGAVGSTVTGTEAVRDALGLVDGGFSETFFWGAPVLGPDDGFLPAGGRRATDGVDTDTAADWVVADDLLGPANTPTAATVFDEAPVVTCPTPLSTTAGTAASGPVTATDPDGTVASFDLAVAPDPGTVALGVVTPSTGAGIPASTSVEVGAATPAGHYQVVVTAVTAAPTPQSASCTVAVVVDPAAEPPGEPPDDGVGSIGALQALLDGLVGAGSTDAGKAQLLQGHLDRAARFLERGREAAAAAELRAFANHAQGFAPRWLSQTDADQLSEGGTALAAALAG